MFMEASTAAAPPPREPTVSVSTVTPLIPTQPPCLTDTAPTPVLAFCDGCDAETVEKLQERTGCGKWMCPDCLDVHYAHGTSWAACHAPECND